LPELVFINCCHLGRLDDGTSQLIAESPHALAASISEELIKMGVKAVVAAGWAVDDEAAAAFAETFYTEMLRGRKFGMAVKAARIKAHEVSSKSNTWGAYQCYGNPDFVLERSGDSSESTRPRDNACYSQREYLEKLADIESDATRANAAGCELLRQQLEALDAALPRIWRDGAVLSAFGAAWKALGNYDRAIASYRETVGEEKATAPFNTVQQLANLLALQADKLAASGDEDVASRRKELIDEAIRLLQWLLELSRSSERFSLIAGCYKRKARAATTWRDKQKWLKSARNFYQQAHLCHQEKTGSILAYPALNWLTYRLLLGEKLHGDLKIIDASIAAAQKAEQIEPSFWNRVAEPDGEVLRYLALGNLENYRANITGLYERALGSGSNQRSRAAVIDHLDFLIETLASRDGKGPAAMDNLEALRRLRATFGTTDEGSSARHFQAGQMTPGV
jgi:hypothetical protein